MLLPKISRADCLNQYPKLPTSIFDSKTEDETFNFPKTYGGGWHKLEVKDNRYLGKYLSLEIIKVLSLLSIKELIFLGDTDLPWISKASKKRKDYLPLKNAILYFTANKIDDEFNGGVRVKTENLSEFIKYIYCIIRCGGPQPYLYFTDESQSILGSIHHSGDVEFFSLRKSVSKKLNDAIQQSNFKHF